VAGFFIGTLLSLTTSWSTTATIWLIPDKVKYSELCLSIVRSCYFAQNSARDSFSQASPASSAWHVLLLSDAARSQLRYPQLDVPAVNPHGRERTIVFESTFLIQRESVMRYVWGVLAVSALFAWTGNMASAQVGGVVGEAGGAVQSGAGAGTGAAGQAGANVGTDATAPVPNVPQAAGSVDTTIQAPAGQERLNVDANAGGRLNPNEQRLGVNPRLDVNGNRSNPNAHLNATGQLNANGNGGVRAGAQIQGNVNGNLGVNGNANNRYRRHNGEWWYWTPAGSWVYYRQGRWNPYVAGSFVQPHIFFGYNNGYNRGYNGNGYYDGNRYNNDGRYRSGYRGNRNYQNGPAVRARVNVNGGINGNLNGTQGTTRGTQDTTRGAIQGTQDATRDAVQGTQGVIRGTDNAIQGTTRGTADAAGDAGGAVGDAAGGLLP
jgi:hypothetical protein